MTKTTAETLREQMANASNLSNGVTSAVLQLKTAYLEEKRRINAHDFIGNRYIATRELERAAATQFFDYLDDIKADYVAIAESAQLTARKALVATPQEPDELTLAEYQKALASLKTKAALKLDADSLERELQSISERFDNDYVNHDLYQQFNELSSSVLATHSDSATRLKLSRTYDKLVSEALSEDQKAANEALSFFKGAENRAMLSQYGNARTALRPILGDYYRYVDNTADGREHIAKLAQEDADKLAAVTQITTSNRSNLITKGEN